MAIHVHRTHRSGWLRAAVLGANDGVLSTTSLLVGVASASMSHSNIVIAGFTGLIGGALSMGAGEYVSVKSQADTEQSDLAMERRSLGQDYAAELAELSNIYITRGVNRDLAMEVAKQLMVHDAIGAHARDEIGITDTLRAKPLQASGSSAVSFICGGLIPLFAMVCSPILLFIPVTVITALIFLTLMGALAAHIGGASILRGGLRVLICGIFAMIVASFAGSLWSFI
jgi:VIT1/CCC1 family predicted Fe2+/Mn2+ transporter